MLRTQLRLPQLWIELFVLVNVSFLVFDIYLAHSTNHFERRTEYIPLIFSMVAPILLVAGLVGWASNGADSRLWRAMGYLVGWVAVAVGILGVILHLESQFFLERTLRSLTYGAPFAAPLAYAGLGLLLVMNRMVNPMSDEWARWVLLLALGGFVGNFIFSLTDHAQNGFFSPLEWIPVITSAFAVGFLCIPLLARVSRRFLLICAAVLVVQALVGILGFVLHVVADLHGPSRHAFANVVYGAPPLAPLLFPNLVILGLIALWPLWQRAVQTGEA
jgi:hypothetical protein